MPSETSIPPHLQRVVLAIAMIGSAVSGVSCARPSLVSRRRRSARVSRRLWSVNFRHRRISAVVRKHPTHRSALRSNLRSNLQMSRHGDATATVHTLAGSGLSSGAAVTVFSGRGSSRAELRMNTSSETTWMPAASSGLRKPKAANTMPSVSTPIVPAKFCQMMPLVCLATASISTKRSRSLPSRTTSALSCATSVPDPWRRRHWLRRARRRR